MKSINLHSHSPILRPCLANYLGELHLGLATKTESRLLPRNPQSDYVSIRYVSSILVTFTTCITLPHHAKPFAPPPTASQHGAMMTASALHPKQSVRKSQLRPKASTRPQSLPRWVSAALNFQTLSPIPSQPQPSNQIQLNSPTTITPDLCSPSRRRPARHESAFLTDHATKGDAIHHAIGAFVHPDSSEMVLLVCNYLSECSSLQNHIFAKARRICAQFTSRLESLGKVEKPGNKSGRLIYFRDKCTYLHLAAVYSHLASAVDIPNIFAARSPNDKAFKDLMTQVFVHSMGDLWLFEFDPSKQGLSANLEKENKE